MKKRGMAIYLIILLGIGGQISLADQVVCTFDFDSLKLNEADFTYEYPGLESINANSEFSLPIKTIYLDANIDLSEADFSVDNSDRIQIGVMAKENASFSDNITGFANRDSEIQNRNSAKLSSVIFDIQNISTGNKTYTAVSFLPITVDNFGNIFFNKVISIRNDVTFNIIRKSELLSNRKSETLLRAKLSAGKTLSASNIPLGYEYVIVTSAGLEASFLPLVDFKNQTGISTSIALIESIYENYDGLDDAEKLREYLKDFYQSGGTYVLLAGDETILPVRYAYYYNTNSVPSDPYYLMPTNLYFADLTGDWDADGDGVWGEPTDDAPDISPELILGRLPIRTAESAQNYISKLIQYSTNPGNGDFGYLNKSLFFSSDEMRDYPTHGQHKVIADELPEYYLVDTVSGVEFPSGSHAAPTNPTGVESIDKVSEGFGFVHIIAHGRIDGFMVRSANYGDWPASLIITGQQVSSHGSIADIEQNDRTSLYYSLSCNLGGYDLDSTDGQPGNWSLVERLIDKESSGAVGMVAYARWGWVYSSYYLQKAFTKHLYGDAEGNPVLAMYNSWVDYPYYRDLIYGQNYYGDPTLTIYTDIPEQMEVITPKYGDTGKICLSSKGQPVINALVTIAKDGIILESGTTDFDGQYTFQTEIITDDVHLVTAVKDGYTVFQDNYVPSLALGVDDEDNLLPLEFELRQNYPNPFNPVTNIEYSLPERMDVSFTIFNILGQEVKAFEFDEQSAGVHTLVWDGVDNNNQAVASGIFFYRITTGEYQETRKMVLIR